MANIRFHNEDTNSWEILKTGAVTDPEETDSFDIYRLQDIQSDVDHLIKTEETSTGVRKGDTWTEWLTVPFSNQPITIIFSKAYLSKPAAIAQVYGASASIPVKVVLNTKTVDGLTVYSGVTITCASGSGSDIALSVIGRV